METALQWPWGWRFGVWAAWDPHVQFSMREFCFYVLVICCRLIGFLCFLWGEALLLLFWIRVLLYRDQSGLETTMQHRLASNSRQPSFLSLPSAGIRHHIWFFVLVWFGFWDSSPSYTPTQNLLPTSRMLRLQACFTMIKTPGLFIYLHLFGFVFCCVLFGGYDLECERRSANNLQH